MPRIALSGATGRLGRAFAEVATGRGWPVVGALASPRTVALGRTLSELGLPGGLVRPSGSEEIDAVLSEATVYVACAPASVEVAHLRAAARAGVPAVVATTGFTAEQESELRAIARRIPVLREANFSVGLHWVRSALTGAAPLPAGFEIGVVEAHRAGKRDRPSGTAQLLVADLAEARRSSATGPIAAVPPPVAVESVRLGELPGIHQVWISGRSELIRVEHLVLDRRAFAEGMAEAAGWLASGDGPRPAGEYRLRDVLTGTEGAP